MGDGFGGDGVGGDSFGGDGAPPPDGGPIDFNQSGSSLDEAILFGMIASSRASGAERRRSRRPGQPGGGGCLLPVALALGGLALLVG